MTQSRIDTVLIIGGPHDGQRVSRSIANGQPSIRMPDPPERQRPMSYLSDNPSVHDLIKTTTYDREWFVEKDGRVKHDLWVHRHVDSIVDILIAGYKSETNHPCERCAELEGKIERMEIVIAGLKEEVLAHREFSNFSADMLCAAMEKRKP